MNNIEKGIWISWERHTRSRSMSHALNVPLFEVISKSGRLKRYIFSIIRTILILSRTRPDVVFFQNPSIVLATLMAIYRRIFSCAIVMDAHNAGIYPREGRSKVLNFIAGWLVRSMNLTIITNQELAEKVRVMGGDGFVVTDPVPIFDICNNKNKYHSESCCMGESKVTLICSWAEDEPFLEVIEAARKLGGLIQLSVTGRIPKSMLKYNVPSNVNLLGFVSEECYVSLLADSDLIVDLTNRQNCLVCGAYEAAALKIPCLLSDNEISKNVFFEGYKFTKNDRYSIEHSIKDCLKELESLKMQIDNFAKLYERRNREQLLSLKKKIEGISRKI